ncbi:MAG: stage III sporulation protein AA, partial [Dysgonamonadaceae bacterium]|nr:stage III sporulation protein AA [Dysgonamonadaceae bacterium]
PIHIAELLKNISTSYLLYLEEIRLRLMRPLMLVIENKDYMIAHDGSITKEHNRAYIVTKDDISKTFQFVSQCSVYSIEEELRYGYITIPGGHRVGFSGHVLLENENIKTMKHISGFNIRVAREIVGAADKVLPYVMDQNGRIFNVLIISPPKAGKTTLLRDIIRQLSSGVISLGIQGFNIGLVDERSEIACCYEGIPQNDVGIRTDVLDGCPKAKGMMLLLRSMSPDIIATDEIGRNEDVAAIEEAINTGVTIITTIHGQNLDDIKRRPAIRKLINRGFFNRYVVLGFSSGVGSIESILEGNSFKNIVKHI